MVLGILAYLSKQFVYNPSLLICLYHDPDPIRGFWWRMAIQHVWNFLTMTGEILTFSSVVIYMIRVKAFESGLWSRGSTSGTRSGGWISASQQYRKPLGPNQYRNVVLRIALYPLSSLATLAIMAIGAITSPTFSRSIDTI
ncbi:hypothetical protein L218DRAFT_305880 [Marasmius fiardii PR-910]|nr:hypothetical protein L218DRAFT_305880 [Marasmius fiardii PR-910]